MTLNVLIMLGVALLAGVIGLWLLLLRLRSRATQQSRYAHGMVGMMALALGVILTIFGIAQWSWGSAS
ncbi:hypothetical protein ASE70_08505 [Sphingomonas sp. Leaf22]|uniref:hypothetical protein n=1 Tax=Sphingomonas sp. Leaf22 TaxID=1735687 RepID=UPI0006F8C486|nr:hypothetical protein [Sphingomonas sp. Leaf22]KQM76793.1 hypothetical protein ASE70_08505 [Sphingomonas sp. Leaf22]